MLLFLRLREKSTQTTPSFVLLFAAGGYPSLDGCPIAEGDISDIGDGTMFIGLQRYQNEYDSPFKLCFGPKSFLVISDPVQARHVLRDANTKYDKGVLAEILEPIMVRTLRCYYLFLSCNCVPSIRFFVGLTAIFLGLSFLTLITFYLIRYYFRGKDSFLLTRKLGKFGDAKLFLRFIKLGWSIWSVSLATATSL